MSDGTDIEWTKIRRPDGSVLKGATWNIITGCSVVSEGCKRCYAMKLAGTRLRNTPSRAGLTIDTKAGPVWNGQVRFNEKWLDQPRRWRNPRGIFVCAHGDLFHESVPDEWLDKIFGIMDSNATKQHIFQVLTKRPQRMHDYMKRYAAKMMGPPTNVWFGVSVENQEAANERIPLLLQTPAMVRWISAEPLLGPLDLTNVNRHNAFTGEHAQENAYTKDYGGGLHWVVVGGESGRDVRPIHPAWIRDIRDQCKAARVAFFFKQWGAWLGPHQDGNPECDPQEINASDMAINVGKKRAGRLLDGRTYNEYPGEIA